jgi:hypothetical protein
MPPIYVLIGWLVNANLAYMLGTSFLETEETATWPEMLRTLTFAGSPSLLLALAGVPPRAVVIVLVMPSWFLATMVIAIQAFAFPTGRAIAIASVDVAAAMLAAILGPAQGTSP